MGASQSHEEKCEINANEKSNIAKQFYFDKYNWVPSFPSFKHKLITMPMLTRKYDTSDPLPGYIDLRTSFPQIQSINDLPFNPIISTVYLLHYQLLKNKLPIFPPSSLYIYKHITYYRNVKSLFSFECIFKSIQNYGFCSENDLSTSSGNLDVTINSKLLEKACAFKFIEVYKVEQDLNVIKTLLKNEVPILAGITVFYDLSTIDSYMWMPDETIDNTLGGLTIVLVGYIDERNMFIAATTFGKNFGTNGYIMIPYDYIINKSYTGELYTIDFKKERVEGYINQRKEMVNLQQDVKTHKNNKKQYEADSFGNLFK